MQGRTSKRKKTKAWTDMYPAPKKETENAMEIDDGQTTAKAQVNKRALGIKIGSKVIGKSKTKGPRGVRAEEVGAQAEKHQHKMKLLQTLGIKIPKQFRKKRSG